MTSLLIHNATLLDGTGADPRERISVLIEGGHISRIAPADALKPDSDTTVIDATGRFLLPGLTDAHVHFSATEADGRATRPLAAFALRVAAFIEAFWSPLTDFPPPTKYAVGALLWAAVVGWLALGGRARGA